MPYRLSIKKNIQKPFDGLTDVDAPRRTLHAFNERFVACSPTTQPSVRRATTGATVLTYTTLGALSSPSWTGLLLIRTSSSPQLGLGGGMILTWYAPIFDLYLHIQRYEPLSLLLKLDTALFWFVC